tara:strand:+ start:170 stop:454 length:285 start_codon:yes stop_codon:yes gene_type:complete
LWGEFISSHAAYKLSALFVKKTNKPGKYSDGLDLYLIVEPTGSKRWEQRLTIRGKRCDLGLGNTKRITIGTNTTVWRSDDIQKLLDDMCAGNMS